MLSRLDARKRQWVGCSVEVLVDCLCEDAFFGFSIREQRHTGAELDVIRFSKYLQCGATFDFQHQLRALFKPRAENGMLKVCSRLAEAGDRVLDRSRTPSQSANLWEDEPHPVTSLPSGLQLRNDMVEDTSLCLDKAPEVEAIA